MIVLLKSSFKHINRSHRLYKRISRNIRILGIETSCDDTSCAVVEDTGKILGEGHFSQAQQHADNGGILPPLARDLHRLHIKNVVNESLQKSQLTVKDVNAIAASVEPGLPMSLEVGLNYAKDLCTLYRKPLIPIHHMKAHALTIRMIEKVEFPFLVFLISGGHCLIVLAETVEKFSIIGDTIDRTPGVVFDKFARRLKLRNLPKFQHLSGGALIEKAAEEGNPLAFPLPEVLSRFRDCNISLSGFSSAVDYIIKDEEKKRNLEPDKVLPNAFDLCASFQWGLCRHFCKRLQRAMLYVKTRHLVSPDKMCLVMSGGVASNKFIRSVIQQLCDEMGCRFLVPPPKLCTDNGIMVAWNGIEKLMANIPPVEPDFLSSVNISHRSPIGENISQDVLAADIKCRKIKLKPPITEQINVEKSIVKSVN